MILILAAMDQELEAIKSKVEIHVKVKQFDTPVYEAAYNGQELIVALTGIGKVSSAMTLTQILERYKIDAILNLGSAGGLQDNQAIGDIVIGTHGSFHDRFFSEVPDLTDANIFYSDAKLISNVNEVLSRLDIVHHSGLIISGDQFLSKVTPHYDSVMEHFADAQSVDMESTTIMQVANSYNVPCVVIRSLSDIPGDDDHWGQFDKYLEKASEQSARVCIEFLKTIKS